MNLLMQLFTGKDGVTHDLGRWSWGISMLALLAGGTVNAVHAGSVDLVSFAQSIAVVVAAHGGALWAKRSTEPDPEAKP